DPVASRAPGFAAASGPDRVSHSLLRVELREHGGAVPGRSAELGGGHGPGGEGAGGLGIAVPAVVALRRPGSGAGGLPGWRGCGVLRRARAAPGDAGEGRGDPGADGCEEADPERGAAGLREGRAGAAGMLRAVPGAAS